ncbi:hypothetical protein OFB84_33775, partial [Escherichia coli]|nr:hypothetical protein [Escherichia coli]
LFGDTPLRVGFGVKPLHVGSIKLIASTGYFTEERALFDMSKESLTDLYKWIFEYNVAVSAFHGDHVLLEFPDSPGCACK